MESSAEAVRCTALTNTEQRSCFCYYSQHLLVILFPGVWEYTIRDAAARHENCSRYIPNEVN